MLDAAEIVARSVRSRPIKSGVYFLIRDGEIVYVGQSTNVDARLAVHAQRGKFDRYFLIQCPADKLNKIELSYLRHLLPVDNTDSATRKIRRQNSAPDDGAVRQMMRNDREYTDRVDIKNLLSNLTEEVP